MLYICFGQEVIVSVGFALMKPDLAVQYEKNAYVMEV